jgi:hypothetical protein
MSTFDASHYDPPAPIVVVGLHDAVTGNTLRDAILLLDTGADVTLLPRSAVEQLGATIDPTSRMELTGFDGSRSFAPAVFLDIVFASRLFRGTYFIIDAERGILGRDVLNHVKLVIDGPQQAWSLIGS